jgi:hypothetical protein
MARTIPSLAVLALSGVMGLVLIGHLWDRYEHETLTLGFNGVYERYLALQAGFSDDPKAYRAAIEAETAHRVVGGETAALEE